MGYLGAGAVVGLVVVRSLMFAGLEDRAASASTMQQLTDAANTYHHWSQLLLALTAAAALLAVAALPRAGVLLAAALLAGWLLWQAGPASSGNVLVAGDATPSAGDVAALVAAADRPVSHAGLAGLVFTVLLAGGYVLLLRRRPAPRG